MTSQASSGIQRPRPSPVTFGVNRSLPRAASFANPSPIAPPPKQVFIDLTDNDQGDRGHDNPAKRLKLDPTSEAANPPGIRSDDEGERGTDVLSFFTPRAGPAWGFHDQVPRSDFGTASTIGQANNPEHSRPISPPPLPIRPWKYGPRSGTQAEILKSRESLRTGDVQTTPYTLEAPSSAPRYNQDKPADFFPWVGSHPEDVLNEQTTKQGHYDRVQLSQNETNTARPSLYSMFKNRPNLQILSSLFVSALEQRQAHGKITSASTFKPPPRVTLTDTKREAWLRDLASPLVPLRKLSRTIPHGIRGKSLLEQCLGKRIPIGRALWLSKCVGANEIRSFKRKGAGGVVAIGGETKWVREWTVCVEQFVEGVINVCGEPNWKDKFVYATSLSARLYNEHLLDQDHYLSWVLSSLQATTMDKLPMWLSTVQVYCKDLLHFRKTGRHLVGLLLERLRLAMDLEANDVLKPVIQRLSQLIRDIAVAHPACFVFQSSWHQIRNTLSSCLDLEDPQQSAVFEQLTSRNARIALRISRGGEHRSLSVRERLISLLDISRAPYDIGKLSTTALGLFENDPWLVRTVVEWSSTIFREGSSRIYLAVRLLRHWQRKGIDIDTPILDVLADPKVQEHLHPSYLFHLISELVRSRSFAVGRYLQWLVARGALNDHSSRNMSVDNAVTQGQADNAKQRWDIQLLSELPRHRVPEHTWNLRNILLARVGISESRDAELVRLVKGKISRRLSHIFSKPTEKLDLDDENVLELQRLNWSAKSEIGQWIRKHVSSHYKTSVLGTTGSKNGTVDGEVSALTTEEFSILRGALEELEDVSMLADVLQDACQAEDAAVLASAADTVSYHFTSLSAIGAQNDLYRLLLGGYRQVKAAELPTGVLIVSLIDLGDRLPNESVTVNYLRQELNRSYQNTAIAACSPVSDHMAGSLQFADMNFPDEFEQFLASGNRMDEQAMRKSFEILSERLVACQEFDHIKSARLHLLLSQVRAYNEKQFDALMLKWVASLLIQNFGRLDKLIPPLIGSGCLAFAALFSASNRALNQSRAYEGPGPRMRLFHLTLSEFEIGKSPLETVRDLLPWLMPWLSRSSSPLTAMQEAYRFRLAQQSYVAKRPTEVLAIIREATIESVESQAAGEGSPLQTTSTASLLRDYVVRHADLVAEHLVQPLIKHSTASRFAMEHGISFLLNPNQDIQNFGSDPASNAKDAVRLLNDFSLPFCQLKLELTSDQRGKETNPGSDIAICEVMFETAKLNARLGMSHWIDIVALLDPQVAQYIREKAEDHFMAIALAEGIFEAPGDDTPVNQEKEATLYLDIIEEMSNSIPEGGVPSIGPFLIERFHLLVSKVGAGKPDLDAKPSKSNLIWFFLLLRLSILHRTTFLRSRTASFDLARLVLTICTLALSPSLRHDTTLITFAFDVAACLVDDIPEETRLQTARFLKEKSRDPQIMFLFGYREEEADRLQIFQRGKLWPYPLRSWELLEEPTPNIGGNDTTISLGLFQARKV